MAAHELSPLQRVQVRRFGDRAREHKNFSSAPPSVPRWGEAAEHHTERMRPMRGEEKWAAQCIQSALGGVEVRQHDDGSRPGMHDLEIVYVDRPLGAAE
jgi:hypothetical protein